MYKQYLIVCKQISSQIFYFFFFKWNYLQTIQLQIISSFI